MAKVLPLPVSRLCARLSPDRIPWEVSSEIPKNVSHRLSLQPRVHKALERALAITISGYNIYLSGEALLGRSYLLKEFLVPRAKKMQTPPDLLFVHNFNEVDKPCLLTVPSGQGKKIQIGLTKVLSEIRKQVPLWLENEEYIKKHNTIKDKFQSSRNKLLKEMRGVANKQEFNVDLDEHGGLTLFPLVEGKRLSEDEFNRLDVNLRQSLKQKGDNLLSSMSSMVRKLRNAEKTFQSAEKNLDQEVITNLLDKLFVPFVEEVLRHCPDNKSLKNYFNELQKDIFEHPESFITRDNASIALHQQHDVSQLCPTETEQYRYYINIFVDNSNTKGAPIVFEDHPTATHLLGCIEREAEMGALITDFTLIKSGSLHKANGGFLILHLDDILQHPLAWEGLLLALRSGVSTLEDFGETTDGTIRTKGIEPESIPLDVKVILVGNEDFYERLLEHDDRFSKLFKIKAQLTSTTERTAKGIRSWLFQLSKIIDDTMLLPFDAESLAGLVDYSSRECEDQKKLSLRFPLIRDVMIEASAIANMAGNELVQKIHLDEAIASRLNRVNLVEELFIEEYDRDLIKVMTTGWSVGRVNGLSVSWYGDFEFGLPHQISCTVGVGHGGIIDLERESELGGPIHTKAMLILKSYLVDQFAKKKPLVLTGSLCFEQNYAGVEGDSASGAELAALLSAVSGVPLKLSLAFTGAVNQSGQIMAVGGVNRKIEGFFEICSRRGLTGEQGVIIPYDNIDHLMLNPKVIEAVKDKKFAIYPVKHITEALELLTDMPSGRPLKKGGFSPNSLYDKVDSRLQELGHLAEHAFSKTYRKKTKK
ncbi:ATP-dependent protease [Lawsonia intracellularis]|uniref:ATP-binding protein n=1 Tax=Lawsonia intracellularis TaxID=29546 RepID=UPI0009788F6D|nr:ATP-binding protein [Lawsonia intracellularis]OMQ02914.1 ATP-dependent protease [Lawsonia intracellularis]